MPPSAIANLRVVRSVSRTPISFEELVATTSMADVVFVGEQHDDPETHFAEFALLEGIGRRRNHVVLSLEMFERDVQPILDEYLGGRMSETDFLAKSRPWERYATDYRALVMLARARGWRVIASNVPRPIASAVSRQGLRALDSLAVTSRAWVASELSCPHDAYFARFAQEMVGHVAAGGPPTVSDATQTAAMTDRFYEAQCVKDETMGESVATALARAGDDGIVIHVTGAFHTDYGQGTASKARRRNPGMRSVVITAIPSADPASAPIDDAAVRADYVIFTKKSGGAIQK